MKEALVSIISACIGVSLLSSAIVGERLKNNVRALSSLVVILSFLNTLSLNYDIPKFFLPEYEFDSGSVFSSTEEYAEAIYSSLVENRISESFFVDFVTVETDITLTEKDAVLESLKVYIRTDEKLVTVLNFIEKEFNAYGKVSVSKYFKGDQ